ncbi:MAG TPA: hypothetical protein VFY59_04745 [Rubrobacter sp.]|nr:hypothetical protein [Rubrobacter sp.]
MSPGAENEALDNKPGGDLMLKAVRPDEPLRHGGLLDTSLLPPGYDLDPSDPDVLLLLRPDGTTAAVFSSRGVTAEGVLEAAGKDRG